MIPESGSLIVFSIIIRLYFGYLGIRCRTLSNFFFSLGLTESLPRIYRLILYFSNPSAVHGARISGLEARMILVEDQLSEVDARGSEESDNLANERDLDRFILTGDDSYFKITYISNLVCY